MRERTSEGMCEEKLLGEIMIRERHSEGDALLFLMADVQPRSEIGESEWLCTIGRVTRDVPIFPSALHLM